MIKDIGIQGLVIPYRDKAMKYLTVSPDVGKAMGLQDGQLIEYGTATVLFTKRITESTGPE